MTAEPAPEAVAPPKPAPRPDSFFGWDQLILLLTPFPYLAAAKAAYVLGAGNATVDKIAGVWITSTFLFSLSTLFIAPLAAALALVWLAGRQIYLRRWKRLALYAVVLGALPLTMRLLDGDDLRFRLMQHSYEQQIAGFAPLAPHTAHCFVFDQVEDHFYLGGANFSPYDKMIVYVSEDLAGKTDPKVERFSPESKCRSWPEVRNIRHLTGRFYLADSFHF